MVRTRVDEVGLPSRYKEGGRECTPRGRVPPVYVIRPACIYPVEPREEPNISYRLLRVAYPAFRVVFPNQGIRADDLARAMVDVAVRRTGEPRALVYENRDIRAMVGSLRSPAA